MNNSKYKLGSGLIIFGFLFPIVCPLLFIVGFLSFIAGAITIFRSDKSLLIKLLTVIIPVLLWFPTAMSFWRWSDKTTPQTLLIPSNFKGRFMVVYGEKCGVKPVTENGRRVLKIPANGILIIQPKFEAGAVDDEYYLIDQKGKRTKINGIDDVKDSVKFRNCVKLNDSGNFGGPTPDGSSSDSPLAINFVDYEVYTKDISVHNNADDKLDSLVQKQVDECRVKIHK